MHFKGEFLKFLAIPKDMSEKSSGCGCCPECTGGPDCTCGCPDCTCGDCSSYNVCCHDDSCCSGESKFVLSAVSSIVGMLFLGILAILYSINYMDVAWGLAPIDAGFVFLLLCVAGVLTFVGILAFKAGDVTEGMLFFIVGFAALVLHGGNMLGYGVPGYMGLIVAVILLIVVAALFAGRDRTFGVAVFAFLVGLLFVVVFESTSLGAPVAAIAFLISGAILLYVAISDWLFVETGADLPV